MTLCELAKGTPEADAMARRILTTLYDLAADAKGFHLAGVKITKQNAPTAADREDALPRDEAPEMSFGDSLIIAQKEEDCNYE